MLGWGVGDSVILLDMFLRGLAVSAMVMLGVSASRAGVSRDQRIATILASISISCWLIVESSTAWAAFGHLRILVVPSLPVGALFWLFVLAVFEDVRVTPLSLAPAAVQV